MIRCINIWIWSRFFTFNYLLIELIGLRNQWKQVFEYIITGWNEQYVLSIYYYVYWYDSRL